MKYLVNCDLKGTQRKTTSRLDHLLDLFSVKNCLIVLLIISVNIGRNEAKITAKNKFCFDADCKEAIATGRTTISYPKGDRLSVSYKVDAKVKIFAKTDDNKHLEIEVNGKRGFAHFEHIQVMEEIHKTPEVKVKIDLKDKKIDSNVKRLNGSSAEAQQSRTGNESSQTSAEEDTKSSKIDSSITEESAETSQKTPTKTADFEVLEGTTIWKDLSLDPTSTLPPEPATATKTPTITVKFDSNNEVKPRDEASDSSPVPYSADNQLNASLDITQTNDSSANSSTEPMVDSRESDDSEVKDTKSAEILGKIKDSIDSKSDEQIDIPEKSSDSASNDDNSADGTDQPEEADSPDVHSEPHSPNDNQSISEEKSKTTVNSSDVVPQTDSQESPEDSITANADTKVVSDSSDSELKDNKTHESDSNSKSSEESSDIGPKAIDNINESSSDSLSQNTSSQTPVANHTVASGQESALPVNGSNNTSDDTNSETNSDLNKREESDIESGIETLQKTVQSDTSAQDQKESIPEPTMGAPNDTSDENISDETHSTPENESTVDSDVKQPDDTVYEVRRRKGGNDMEADEPLVQPNDVNYDMSADTHPTEDEPKVDISVETTDEGLAAMTEQNDTMSVGPTEPVEDLPLADVKPEEAVPEIVFESRDIFKWMGLEGMVITDVISDIIPDDIEMILKQFQISAQVVVFTFIIAFNWCLMKILLSVMSSSKRETQLRNICCKTQRQVYYFEAEKQKLQTEIDREREKALIAEERMQSAEHKVIPLEKELLKLKSERDQLHQKVNSLETELDSATEAGLEASRLLNDFMASQRENINLNSSVDALEQQITKQADIVSRYESTARHLERENIEFKEKMSKMSAESERLKNVLKETEHNLQTVQHNNEELKASKAELNAELTETEEQYSGLRNKVDDYIRRNDELLDDVQRYNEELKSLKDDAISKDMEIESLKEILTNFKNWRNDNDVDGDGVLDENEEQIDGEKCDKAFNNLYDIVEMEVKLKNMTNEKNELNSKLVDVGHQCRQLTERLTALEADNKAMASEKGSALQDRMKAQMELEVLTKYYKEKEVELGKEIGVQQVKRRLKEEDASSMASQMAALEEENESVRSQLQSMKREISDTERKYKSQINQLEKQVHENWVLARSAERKLEESKAEASVLRQTLTMSVKSPVDGFGGDASFMDDSASSVSSLHDQYGALPPPPPPPLPPPPPMFNPMMGGMHMPFPDEHDSGNWSQNMNPMAMGSHYPPMPNSFLPIASDGQMSGTNPTLSYPGMNANHASMNYVPSMGQQWDSTSNRDTFSPSSHRSTSSPHSQYNSYSQPPSHYAHHMASMTMSSPMPTNSMGVQYPNSMAQSVISPLVNSSPAVQPVNVLSNPIPSHWAQPNGNISNLDYSHSDYNNESTGSSRPTSRADSSLHTSMV